MPVRALTDEERAAAPKPPPAPDTATYGPAGGKATYRGQDLEQQEEVPVAGDHQPA